MNNNNQGQNFSVRPEKREFKITKDHQADIRFEVASRMPLRGEAHLIPVSADGRTTKMVKGRLASWLSIVGDRELDFTEESGGYRPYTVRITVPDDAEPGVYIFRLKVVDVAQPDEIVGESPNIIFHVEGPKPSFGLFITVAVAAFLILTAAIFAAVDFVQNETTLQVTVDGPKMINAGLAPTYTINVTNKSSREVTGVRLEYTVPEGVIGAYATVDDAVIQHCDERSGDQKRFDEAPPLQIYCNLGSLSPQESKSVNITAILDPNGVDKQQQITATQTPQSQSSDEVQPTAVIEQTFSQWQVENTFIVSSNEVQKNGIRKQITTNVQRCLQTTDKEHPGCEELFVTIDPSSATIPLGREIVHTIRIWNNDQFKEAEDVNLTYELPEGMRYVLDENRQPLLPEQADCYQPSYFEVICTLEEPLETAVGHIEPTVLELTLIPTGAGSIKNIATVSNADYLSATTTTETVNVNTALRFDGIYDWVELDFKDNNGLPEKFTVEMWVHPFSTDNGQSFIAAHTKEGKNIFQIGYWQEKTGSRDGLLINIHGAEAIVTNVKRTSLHHLAVTVAKNSSSTNRYDVNTYIDGQLVDERVFAPTIEEADEYGNWVLGQDWDPDSPELRKTDFYKGTLSEVRIWNTVRTPDEIADSIAVRPTGEEEDLLAYWRLEPPATNNIVPDLSITKNDESRNGVPLDDTLKGGARLNGATWGGIDPRFGTALEFNGTNNVLVPLPSVTADESPSPSSLDLAIHQPVSLTLSAWLNLPGIPTERQWIVGQVGSAEIETIRASVADINQQLADLDTIQAAHQITITANIAAARAALDTAIAVEHEAQRDVDIAILGEQAGEEITQQNEEVEALIAERVGQIQQSATTYQTSFESQQRDYDKDVERLNDLLDSSSSYINNKNRIQNVLRENKAIWDDILDMEMRLLEIQKLETQNLTLADLEEMNEEIQQLHTDVLAIDLARNRQKMTQQAANFRVNRSNYRGWGWDGLPKNWSKIANLFDQLKESLDAERTRTISEIQSTNSQIDQLIDLVTERDRLAQLKDSNNITLASAQEELEAAQGNVRTAEVNLAIAQSAQTVDRSADREQLIKDRENLLARLDAEPGKILATGLVVDDDGHIAMVAVRGRQNPLATDRVDLLLTIFSAREERAAHPDKWVHYAGTVALLDETSDPSLQLMRNGKVQASEVTSTTANLQMDCSPGVYIGGVPSSDCATIDPLFFSGKLDEIRVWNRILMPEEILSWRERPNEFADDMVAYWPFDDSPSRYTDALCGERLSCDETPNGYHINVRGPIWVDTNFIER